MQERIVWLIVSVTWQHAQRLEVTRRNRKGMLGVINILQMKWEQTTSSLVFCAQLCLILIDGRNPWEIFVFAVIIMEFSVQINFFPVVKDYIFRRDPINEGIQFIEVFVRWSAFSFKGIPRCTETHTIFMYETRSTMHLSLSWNQIITFGFDIERWFKVVVLESPSMRIRKGLQWETSASRAVHIARASAVKTMFMLWNLCANCPSSEQEAMLVSAMS